MSPLLHMETDAVRSLAGQIRSALDALSAQNQGIAQNSQALCWQGQSRDEFVAEMDAILRQINGQIETGIVLAGRAEREAGEWEQTAAGLAGGYSDFRAEMRQVLSHVMVSGGAVLGAATLASMPLSGGVPTQAELTQHYQSLKWSDKFKEQNRLNSEIARLETWLKQNRGTGDIGAEIADVENQLADLKARRAEAEAQIADLRARRAEAEAKSNNLFNQILPDWPLALDPEDGVPWRVKADDYQDEMANYDAQIAQLTNDMAGHDAQVTQLEARHQILLDERATVLANTVALTDLKSQQGALSSVINQGILADGPTKPDWYKNGFGGCTNYVAEKRDLYVSDSIRINGNAQDWKQSAINGGWDVGKAPAKGSVMVFQGEASKDYGTANRAVGGHVAYVENVQVGSDGNYKVTISEASTIFNKDGSFVRGAHTPVKTRVVTVPANGHKYVDFIYDR